MFVNAMSEKDKRLITESEAKGIAKGEAKGIAKGRIEGLAEGELKALRKTAKQMKDDGMPVDVISKYTGLPQKEIKDL